jgi:hypothetical protein
MIGPKPKRPTHQPSTTFRINPNADALARRKAKTQHIEREPEFIKDMPVGFTGWAVPWAFDRDVRKLHADYTVDHRSPIETNSRMVRITRVTDTLFQVKDGTTGPVHHRVVLQDPDAPTSVSDRCLPQEVKITGCSCITCNPAEAEAEARLVAAEARAAKYEAGKAASIKAEKDAQAKITAQIEARAKAKADKEADEILAAGQPPAWDPLGAAPFAWTLPEPGPAPAPPRGKVRTFFDGQGVGANIFLAVTIFYLALTIMYLVEGAALWHAALNLFVACLYAFNVWVWRGYKADRVRHQEVMRTIREGEDPTW